MKLERPLPDWAASRSPLDTVLSKYAGTAST